MRIAILLVKLPPKRIAFFAKVKGEDLGLELHVIDNERKGVLAALVIPGL
jgi:hypothetical protein